MPLHGRIDQPAAVVTAGDVGCHGVGTRHGACDLLEALAPAGREHNVRARARGGGCHLDTKPGACAGDHHDAPVEWLLGGGRDLLGGDGIGHVHDTTLT